MEPGTLSCAFALEVILDVLPVGFEQDVRVLSADKVRRGYIVSLSLQPLNDLLGSLLVGDSALRVKVGKYLV